MLKHIEILHDRYQYNNTGKTDDYGNYYIRKSKVNLAEKWLKATSGMFQF